MEILRLRMYLIEYLRRIVLSFLKLVEDDENRNIKTGLIKQRDSAYFLNFVYRIKYIFITMIRLLDYLLLRE